MAQPIALCRIFLLIAAGLILAIPALLHAEGISLVADLEYFLNNQNSTEKATGIVTDSELSRFTQLYRLDLTRAMYPNILIRLGGDYENDDNSSDVQISDQPEFSSDTTERTIRPYISVDLNNPLYRASLGYLTRDVETSRSFGGSENFMMDEYRGLFSWRPVDLPLLNVTYQRTEIHDDPLTIDSTRDVMNVLTRYNYRDFRFQYTFSGRDTYDNLDDSGSLTQSHNGAVVYHRGFDYGYNRFDVNAAARIIQSSVEFSGTGSDQTVDTPAAESGTPFYILNDSPATSNEPFELNLVEGTTQLADINIGRGGGISPVSAGLSFAIATEMSTIYIQLSEDSERFPDLASPSQVAEIASSLRWHFYSSDDQFELNWTEHSIASAVYNSVDNRFEIRLSSPVSARRIKVTTTPLTLTGPGEIRYRSIRSFTTLGSREPENLDQSYSAGLSWSPGERTIMGYEVTYRNQESEPGGSQRTTWTNSVNFRHILNPVFSTYGRVYRINRTRSTRQGDAEDSDQSYSLALRGDYFATLNQSLIFTGFDSSRFGEDSSSKSILLRTNAILYEGWSMSMDLNYSLNTLTTGVDQTVKSLYLDTTLEPNRWININADYSAIWSEEEGRIDSLSQYGTFQVLWSITNTLNTIFRYSFRDQEGTTDFSSYLREFNVSWSPFPDGELSFVLGYNDSIDEADQELKTISPTLTWRVTQAIFLELRYDTGTLESPVESSDFDSLTAKLRFFY
ncbi:MAG: hypothetical protein SCH71_02235 [Desulfobulbaceae bacterium]|nr:hypothetical protein [Desulfobulbaceae bacterium]